MRGTGFLLGAAAGLALALLVVGAASFLPHSGNPFASSSAHTLLGTPASSSASTPGPVGGAANAARAPQGAGVAPPVSSQTVASPSVGSTSAARPSSLLTVLPGESASGLLATVSPLILGIAVALLVYAVYSRREDTMHDSAA